MGYRELLKTYIRHLELVALRAAGIPVWRILAPILAVGALASGAATSILNGGPADVGYMCARHSGTVTIVGCSDQLMVRSSSARRPSVRIGGSLVAAPDAKTQAGDRLPPGPRPRGGPRGTGRAVAPA